jgi:hypothetical protein
MVCSCGLHLQLPAECCNVTCVLSVYRRPANPAVRRQHSVGDGQRGYGSPGRDPRIVGQPAVTALDGVRYILSTGAGSRHHQCGQRGLVVTDGDRLHEGALGE